MCISEDEEKELAAVVAGRRKEHRRKQFHWSDVVRTSVTGDKHWDMFEVPASERDSYIHFPEEMHDLWVWWKARIK